MTIEFRIYWRYCLLSASGRRLQEVCDGNDK
jgi:hypothetical protein